MVTALLNVRFKILNLLASILTMIALFSVNLRGWASRMSRLSMPIR
jgi:ABC-type uncharacterized transport system permease subunit